MTQNLERARKTLSESGCTLCIVNSGEVKTSDNRGISPLLDMLKCDPDFLNGSSAADKIIGKSAALLMVLGNIREVYTHTISRHALKVFEDNGIPVIFEKEVPYVKNRDKTGMCPMENAVLGTDNPELAYQILLEKLLELRK